MKDGFIRVACASPIVSVADTEFNTEHILNEIDKADAQNVNVLAFPELSVTGATCADLFFSDALISSAEKSLKQITTHTKGKYPVIVLGVPLSYKGKLYNCSAVLFDGSILGIVPKTELTFDDKRYFVSGNELEDIAHIDICGTSAIFSRSAVFKNSENSQYSFTVQVGSDIYSHALDSFGASLIINNAAISESIGRANEISLLSKSFSKRNICGFAYSGASPSESTQDCVYSGYSFICEEGSELAVKKSFDDCEMLISEIDVASIDLGRRRSQHFDHRTPDVIIDFDQSLVKHDIVRSFSENPFLSEDALKLNEQLESILKIQAYGLKKRVEHVKASKLVIGISGGLDSTLALIVAHRAMNILCRPTDDIIAITMPCFGTTDRTKSNAYKLCEYLGISLKEIPIGESVKQHFADIGQDEDVRDAAYENSQARERTQVLMDVANMVNGIVVGTGDLSELALGWATYNGDHMSMYAVNAGIPKTVVKELVKYTADISCDDLKAVLLDILDTPVSPELLPANEDGQINQKTEDLVGPYQLHDFFIYYTLKYNFSPLKIFRIAKSAFENVYSDEVILHWLKVFVRRFFTQQFKRSCMPDGPKVFSVSLSPRGDFKMPSDASYNIWLKQLEKM